MKRSHADICCEISTRLQYSKAKRAFLTVPTRPFDLLSLPTDVLINCLSFAIGSSKDALFVSLVCHTLKHVLFDNAKIASNVLVLITPDNARKFAHVHPHWERFICFGDISAKAVSSFRSSIRTLSIVGSTVINPVLFGVLSIAPTLRELDVSAPCYISMLANALRFMNGLEILKIQHPVSDSLAIDLPISLTGLEAPGICESAVCCLPVLRSLKWIELKSYCCEPEKLSIKVPCLNRYVIDPRKDCIVDQLVNFAPFTQLRHLELMIHCRYSVPSSLATLETFQSNEIIGPLPHKLHELVVFQNEGKEPLTGQLEQLCSFESLQIFSGCEILPSTLRRLSELPALTDLGIYYPESQIDIHRYTFKSLRALTITDCSDVLFYYQLCSLTSLVDLAIFDSSVSHAVIHRLLKMLTGLKVLTICSCPRVCVGLLKFRFPNVEIC